MLVLNEGKSVLGKLNCAVVADVLEGGQSVVDGADDPC